MKYVLRIHMEENGLLKYELVAIALDPLADETLLHTQVEHTQMS